MKLVLRALALIVAAASVWAQSPIAIRITAARANIRATPAPDAPVLEQVTEGAYLELLGEEGAWFQVRLPPNPRFPGIRAVGYVSKTVARLITAAEAAAAADAVRRPIAKPPGGAIGIAADHSGATTWLKAAGTRAVPVFGSAPASAASSPALLQALGQVGAGESDRVPAGVSEVIWVWAVAADAPAPVLSSRRPSFFVSYRDVPGLDPNEWTPGVVRLQPVEGSTWRVVSAASGPADARSRDDADWAVLRDLSERSVRVSLSGSGPGLMRMTLNAPLEPGEYAVVLRPVYAARRYAGHRMLGGEGEGVAFGAVWLFTVK